MMHLLRNILILLVLALLSSCGGEEEDGTPKDRVDSRIELGGLAEDEISAECIFIKEILLFPPQQCYLQSDLISVVPPVDMARYRCGTYAETACCIDDIFRVPDIQIGEVGMALWLVRKVETALIPQIGNLYNALVGTSSGAPYAGVINSMMVLAIMLYGSSIALGLTSGNAYMALMFVVRIIFVSVFALNWDIFETVFIRTIEDGIVDNLSNIVLSAVSGDTSGVNYDDSLENQFTVIDQMLSYFFNWKYFQLIMALLTSAMGWVYAILLVILMFAYIFVVIEAVQLYLFAMFGRAILYILAPIFIPFLVLDQTRTIFAGWFKQLINFSLQPVFVFAFVGLFHMVFVTYVTDGGLLKYEDWKVCKKHLFSILEGIFEFFPWPKITDVNENVIDGKDLPINLWVVVSLLLLIYMMKRMMSWSMVLAGRLSGGVVTMSGITVQGWEGMKEQLKVAPAAMLAGTKGLIVGKRTAPGMKGVARRQGGLIGYLQGRGTVGEGFKQSGGTAYRKQKSKARDAVKKAFLGK